MRPQEVCNEATRGISNEAATSIILPIGFYMQFMYKIHLQLFCFMSRQGTCGCNLTWELACQSRRLIYV